MVLTLGSPPEKGEKKKNPSINLGQSARKGRKKKEKKRGHINPGQPAGKGRKKKEKKKDHVRLSVEVPKPRSGPRQTDAQTDRQVN